MIILKPIATPQTIKFIGRYDLCDLLVFRDDQTNTEVELFADFSLDKYYLTADVIFDLKEGRTYNLKAYKTILSDYEARVLLDSGIIESLSCLEPYNTINRIEVYRDNIYCTGQTVSDFTINENEYIQHESNNDYIVI